MDAAGTKPPRPARTRRGEQEETERDRPLEAALQARAGGQGQGIGVGPRATVSGIQDGDGVAMEFVPSKTNSIKKQRKDLQIRGPAGTLPLCTSTPPPIDSTSNL